MDDILSQQIGTFEGGKYTSDVRACCYELLSLNVSVSNVKAVTESVLTNIAHKKFERLPKKNDAGVFNDCSSTNWRIIKCRRW